MLSESSRIVGICQENGCLEILFAEPIDEQQSILRIRSDVWFALKTRTRELLDVVVPPAYVGKLVDVVDEIAKKYGIYLPAYRHVGDGNLHIHILKDEGKDHAYVKKVRDEVHQAVTNLGGGHNRGTRDRQSLVELHILFNRRE